MASSSIILPSIPGPPLKSQFFGGNRLFLKPFFTIQKQSSTQPLTTCAKFDLSQILGGRGLCNGEQGLQQELKKNIEEQASSASDAKQEQSGSVAISTPGNVPEDAFEKELMGLTGGFPGGEKGLITFIERNPPPRKTAADSANLLEVTSSKKPKAPELPLLMPGMIAIVNNPNNPYYMYCGIVQRITDGKAGVLFEGGNWDRLITFRLDELQRREKGPPLKNPKSAILEPLLEKKDSK
ncbi:hypothetical protein I3760_11G118300 [Carya illinoinensis]|nr:hypothetical protein I3760_11G118300 [Carya illinoinensis]